MQSKPCNVVVKMLTQFVKCTDENTEKKKSHFILNATRRFLIKIYYNNIIFVNTYTRI